MENLVNKLKTSLVIKTSITINFISQICLLYTNNLIEGKIKYFGNIFLFLSVISTIFCGKDFFYSSNKTEGKFRLLKNLFIGMLIYSFIYYPLCFYKAYNSFKNSYSFILFLLGIISSNLLNCLLLCVINNYLRPVGLDKKTVMTEEQIEEDIKRAMIEN